MDNSSRNIVKFIATITVVALLIMAARFYADSQKVTPPTVTDEAAQPNAAPTTETVEAMPTDPEADAEQDPEQVIEEDAELIMGEPSVNLEMGGTESYAQPQQPEVPAAPPADQ